MRSQVLVSNARIPLLSNPARFFVLYCIAALVAAACVAAAASGDSSRIMVSLAFAMYGGTLALPFLVSSKWSLFDPLIFMVLWHSLVRDTLPRMHIYMFGLEYTYAAPGASPDALDNVVMASLLLKGVGLIAFFCGYACSPGWRIPHLKLPAPSAVILKVGMAAALSLGALLMLVEQAGSVGHLLLQRGLPADARLDVALGGRHWHFMVELLAVACLVWLSVKPAAWRTPPFIVALLLSLAIGFTATGSRSGIILPLIMMGSLWVMVYGRVPYAVVTAGVILSLLILGMGGEFRTGSRGADTLAAVSVDSNLLQSFVAGVEQVAEYSSERDGTLGIIAAVPDRVGHLYGRSYLSIIFAPVPSALLPFDKPLPGGRLTAIRIFSNPLSSVPPGNIGEAYWNYHVPGVVFVMGIFGFLMRWCLEAYKANAGVPGASALYVITLFMLQPNSPAMFSWLQWIVPATAFVIVLCGIPRAVAR